MARNDSINAVLGEERRLRLLSAVEVAAFPPQQH